MSPLRQCLVLFVWIVCIGVGLTTLMQYDLTPGRIAKIPEPMPPEVEKFRHGDVPTLLFFAHPKCPCTLQALDDLAALLHRDSRPVQACGIFVCPPGKDQSWAYGAAWDKAEKIERVSRHIDLCGAIARACHVETSGQLLVYSTSQRLVFCGGLTNSRGSGLPGSRIHAVLAAWDAHPGNTFYQPVYGCPLFDSPLAPGD